MSLSPAELDAVDRRGCITFERLLDPGLVARLLAGVDGPTPASGTRHLDGLETTHADLALFWCHPRILAAARAIVGNDLRLSGVSYRGPAPGYGAQTLHIDWRPGAVTAFPVCNAFLALVDFRADNGSTRVVPGSHRSGRVPTHASPDQRQAGEERLLGPAGTVFVFNGHLWHSGTRNDSRATRHSLHTAYRGAAAQAFSSTSPEQARSIPDWVSPVGHALLRK